jgi:hypothetical protein
MDRNRNTPQTRERLAQFRGKRQRVAWKLLVGAALVLVIVATGALAGGGGDTVAVYTACLRPDGNISKTATGDTPLKPCGKDDKLIRFSGGTITQVNPGPGLAGGSTNGPATLSIDIPFRLPQACSDGQFAKWNAGSTAWNCSTGTQGEKGDQGDPGPPGTSDVYSARSDSQQGIITDGEEHTLIQKFVPAGTYFVSGKTFVNDRDHRLFAVCKLNAGSDEVDRSVAADEDDDSSQTLALQAVVTFPNGGTLEIACFTLEDGLDAFRTSLIAVKVGAAH